MKQRYQVSFDYSRGRWYGRGNIIPIADRLTHYCEEVVAHSAEQALFLARKQLMDERQIKLIYVANVRCKPLEVEQLALFN